MGKTSIVRITETENEILDALEENEKMTVYKLARAINKDLSYTRCRLITLWTKGKVRREEIGDKTYYTMASKEPRL